MSDGSGAYIILLKLKIILFTWTQHNINLNTHTLKCGNENYQYYSNHTQCGLMHGHTGHLPAGPTSKGNPYYSMYVVNGMIFNV